MANLITLDDYKTSEKIESTKDDARLNDLIALYKCFSKDLLWEYYSRPLLQLIRPKLLTLRGQQI